MELVPAEEGLVLEEEGLVLDEKELHQDEDLPLLELVQEIVDKLIVQTPSVPVQYYQPSL